MITCTEDDKVQAGAGCFWTSFTSGGSSPGSGGGGGGGGGGGSGGGGGGGGGSIWQFFDQMDFAGPSPIEVLLEKKDCSIDALLKEDDVIQELRAGHRGLVARFSQPDAAMALINHVTREPPEGLRTQSLHFVACQVLTCEVSELFEVWFSPEHPELLDTFWSFLDNSPINFPPVLAGYFTSVVMSMLERYGDQVAFDLRRRGAETVLGKIIERLDSRSLAELLAALSGASTQSRMVFNARLLVDRLLAVLHDKKATEDAQEHAQLVLSELLARGEGVCFAQELLALLTAPSAVEPLLQLVLSAEPRQASAAAAVLAAAAFHAGGASMLYGQDSTSFHSLSPLANTRPPEEDPLDSLMGLSSGAKGDGQDFREAAPPAVLRESSNRSIPVSGGQVESQCTQLVTSVCSQFSGVRELLEAAIASDAPPAAAASGGGRGRASASAASRGAPSKNGAGAAALRNVLEVILLLTLLLKARRPEVLGALGREDLLTPCMKVLLCHPWSSLLHNAIASLFSEVLGVVDGMAVALVRGFSKSGGVVELVIGEYKKRQKLHDRTCPGRSHVGYFGHLHTFCVELDHFCEIHRHAGAAAASGGAGGGRGNSKGSNKSGGEQLLRHADWDKVVRPAVEAIRSHQSEDLGGGIPAEIRALAATGLDFPCGGLPGITLPDPNCGGYVHGSLYDDEVPEEEIVQLEITDDTPVLQGGETGKMIINGTHRPDSTQVPAPRQAADFAIHISEDYDAVAPPAGRAEAQNGSKLGALGPPVLGSPAAVDKSCCVIL